MEDQQFTEELKKYLSEFNIQEIDQNVNFWMVRSKSGYFYQEFVMKKFIALGWNFIDSKTDMGSQSIQLLKDQIKERYGESRPMGPINKCIKKDSRS